MLSFSKRLTSNQIVRFLISGSIAFLVDFGTLNFLIYILKFNPYINIPWNLGSWDGVLDISAANTIAIILGMVTTFCLNMYWTFKSHEQRITPQVIRFLIVFSFSLVVNNLFYGFFVVNHNFFPPLAKVIVTLMQMCWNFFLYRALVFKRFS